MLPEEYGNLVDGDWENVALCKRSRKCFKFYTDHLSTPSLGNFLDPWKLLRSVSAEEFYRIICCHGSKEVNEKVVRAAKTNY